MMKGCKRLAMVVLWPAFLTAAMADGIFFSLVEPDALGQMTPVALYTIGFFGFWALCAVACMLTYYLMAVPEDV